eukprot:TRINITY_DN3602_c0_g1_i1.p1 TRINITY_DN3602_c0_g1~~TRINITY_DN3602_c0_g1_i1.p1  ORF type:complete len:367 (+),score=175.55 TRINITY_DN3602_c0_g1_i1:190-1290(+)
MQALCALVLVVGFTTLHMIFDPYEAPIMDQFEFFSLATSFTTFYCGQYLFVSELGDVEKMLVSFIILGVNAFFFVLAGIYLVRMLKANHDKEAHAKEVGGADDAEGMELPVTDKIIPRDLKSKKQLEEEEAEKHGHTARWNRLQKERELMTVAAGATADMMDTRAGAAGVIDVQTLALKRSQAKLDDRAPDPPVKCAMRLGDMNYDLILLQQAEFTAAFMNDLTDTLQMSMDRFEFTSIQSVEGRDEVVVLFRIMPSPQGGMSPQQIADRLEKLVLYSDPNLRAHDTIGTAMEFLTEAEAVDITHNFLMEEKHDPNGPSRSSSEIELMTHPSSSSVHSTGSDDSNRYNSPLPQHRPTPTHTIPRFE